MEERAKLEINTFEYLLEQYLFEEYNENLYLIPPVRNGVVFKYNSKKNLWNDIKPKIIGRIERREDKFTYFKKLTRFNNKIYFTFESKYFSDVELYCFDFENNILKDVTLESQHFMNIWKRFKKFYFISLRFC